MSPCPTPPTTPDPAHKTAGTFFALYSIDFKNEIVSSGGSG